jgi:glycosyltransferase involved in cell wall biosynthesis
LGRIARELATLFHKHEKELGIRVAQLGMYHDVDTTWPWPVWRMHDEAEYGAEDVQRVWWRFAGERPGVIFTIWDPARCTGVVQEALKLPVRLWGYFPIDGTNPKGTIGGPPVVGTIKKYDRVLGYGNWGAGVLQRITGKESVPWLPHGLDLVNWRPRDTQKVAEKDFPIHKEYIGAVMANQPRKDFGTLFRTWQLMKRKHEGLKFWLHTDLQVKHWSVPQLAEDFGFNQPDSGLVVTEGLTDDQLAEWYSACWLTMLPSLGEGFGYPIVESLACGVPVLAYDGAGGRELVPRLDWLVKGNGERLESCFNIVRPTFDPREWADKAEGVLEWAVDEQLVVREYCQGAVKYLGWESLFPRWAAWVAQGVKEIRG